MISLEPLRLAKAKILARAARARQRVVLLVRKTSAAGRIYNATRIFEPYNRRDGKNGSVTYFGVDTKTKQFRQFSLDNIVNIQIANGRNRFTKGQVAN